MSADDKFFAWLDGELSGAEAAQMAARVESDPALAALAEQHRAMQARVKGAFDAVARSPVPQRLERAASQQSNVVDFGARRERRAASALPGLPQWAAIAATLVLGLFFGTLIPGRSGAPVQIEKGAIYASGDLGHALDAQLASAPQSGSVRIGLTFRDTSGSVCRSFAGSEASGLACRDNDRWRVKGLFPANEGQSGDYRMAAGMNPALAALVDSTMAGEAMDATQERKAQQNSWR